MDDIRLLKKYKKELAEVRNDIATQAGNLEKTMIKKRWYMLRIMKLKSKIISDQRRNG